MSKEFQCEVCVAPITGLEAWKFSGVNVGFSPLCVRCYDTLCQLKRGERVLPPNVTAVHCPNNERRLDSVSFTVQLASVPIADPGPSKYDREPFEEEGP